MFFSCFETFKIVDCYNIFWFIEEIAKAAKVLNVVLHILIAKNPLSLLKTHDTHQRKTN